MRTAVTQDTTRRHAGTEIRPARWDFAHVPLELVGERSVSDGAVRTYLVLQGLGSNVLSYSRICEARGVSSGDLARHLHELEETGWLRLGTRQATDPDGIVYSVPTVDVLAERRSCV